MSYLLPSLIVELAAQIEFIDLIIMCHLDFGKAITAGKGIFADLLQCGRDSKVFQAAAAAESIPAHSYGAFGKCDTFQVFAAAESGIGYYLNGIGNEDPHQIGAVAESAFIDDTDIIGNKDLGNALLILVPFKYASFDLVVHSIISLSNNRSISPF